MLARVICGCPDAGTGNRLWPVSASLVSPATGEGTMSRQAVIETGSWSVKAGLWEQSFTPTTVCPAAAGRS